MSTRLAPGEIYSATIKGFFDEEDVKVVPVIRPEDRKFQYAVLRRDGEVFCFRFQNFSISHYSRPPKINIFDAQKVALSEEKKSIDDKILKYREL